MVPDMAEGRTDGDSKREDDATERLCWLQSLSCFVFLFGLYGVRAIVQLDSGLGRSFSRQANYSVVHR